MEVAGGGVARGIFHEGANLWCHTCAPANMKQTSAAAHQAVPIFPQADSVRSRFQKRAPHLNFASQPPGHSDWLESGFLSLAAGTLGKERPAWIDNESRARRGGKLYIRWFYTASDCESGFFNEHKKLKIIKTNYLYFLNIKNSVMQCMRVPIISILMILFQSWPTEITSKNKWHG